MYYRSQQTNIISIPSMVTKLRGLLIPQLSLAHRSQSCSGLSEAVVEEKLAQYTSVRPTPVSIAQFIERGQTKKMSEAESYRHLVHECLVRLSHMITEVKQFPRELREQVTREITSKPPSSFSQLCCQRDYQLVHSMYLDTYKTLLEFETKEPSKENINLAVKFLNERKLRHKDTVPLMAGACMAMR